MNTLYLEEDLSDAKVRTLLRARTLTVLERLGPRRKTQVMQFLSEAELVTSVDGKEPIITLDGASLSDADLRAADLSSLDLRGANLTSADLSYTNLQYADLSGARLSGAELFLANLEDANLSGAILVGADLRGADLRGATGITNEELEQQDSFLEGATMPDGSKHP
jgi:uncharacterized protein YjbI with pentapeptide repeats